MSLREIINLPEVTNDSLKQIEELENIINDTKVKLNELRQSIISKISQEKYLDIRKKLCKMQ